MYIFWYFPFAQNKPRNKVFPWFCTVLQIKGPSYFSPLQIFSFSITFRNLDFVFAHVDSFIPFEITIVFWTSYFMMWIFFSATKGHTRLAVLFPNGCAPRGWGPGVLSYSLGGGVPLGSQNSYSLLDQILQILWPYTRLKILNCSWFQSFVSDPVKRDPILDQFSMITRPYTRLNGLIAIPFPAAHTHIANIWKYPPPLPMGCALSNCNFTEHNKVIVVVSKMKVLRLSSSSGRS